MSAQFNRASARVCYTSRSGCTAIANLASPQSGPNSTAALQAIANLAAPSGSLAGGPLEIVVDQPLLVGNISLYTGTTIRGLSSASYSGGVPAYGLWMASLQNPGVPQTNSCILKNANWASNYNGGSPTTFTPTNITDRDIIIKDLYLDGQKRVNAQNNPYATVGTGITGLQNPNGQFCMPIQLYGVQNVTCQNLYIYDPIAYGIHSANIQGGHYTDITAIDLYQLNNPTNCNYTSVAVLQFCGPWDNLVIDGLYGIIGDDFLAFNMVDGNISTNNSTTSGAACFGGYSTCYYGNGGYTTVRRLYPTQCLHFLRVLYGSDPRRGGANPTVLSSLTVENAAGGVVSNSFTADGGSLFGAGGGGMVDYLRLSNWRCAINTTASLPGLPEGFKIPPANQVVLDDIQWYDIPNNSLVHQIQFASTVGEITLRDYKIFDDASAGSAPVNPMVQIAAGNTIGGITLEGCKWLRNANTAQTMVSMTGGTLTRGIKLVGVEANNINNVVSITGGTLGTNCSIDSTGLTHQNANSNPSISIGSGVTLPRLRAGASNTLQLQGGSGTVTSKKTDSTEDS